MKALMKTALAALLFTGACSANATLVTIEPDDYAVGAVVGTEEATLRFVRGGRDVPLTYYDAVAATHTGCSEVWCAAPTGKQVLSDGLSNSHVGVTGNFRSDFAPVANGDGTTEFAGMFRALRIDFESPINYFDALMFGGSNDGINLFAYSTTGQLLYSANFGGTTAGYGKTYYDIQMTRESSDIAYLFIGGRSAAAGIDRIRYDVPEPATLGMMALGLLTVLGMGRTQRRR